MKKHPSFILCLLTIHFLSCNAQDKNVLNATEFEQKITPQVQLIDVRTVEEYKNGHLKDAQLLDIYNPNFEQLASKFDKSKPILVYCKAGGRSAKAAQIFADLGYKTVFDLKGGIMEWENKNMPIEAEENSVKLQGMPYAEFDKLIAANKILLVVFSAKWCTPCKKMAPFFEEIALEYKNIKLIKFDVDENSTLVDQYEIKAMPTIMLFKSGKIVWRNEGYVEKVAILDRLK